MATKPKNPLSGILAAGSVALAAATGIGAAPSVAAPSSISAAHHTSHVVSYDASAATKAFQNFSQDAIGTFGTSIPGMEVAQYQADFGGRTPGSQIIAAATLKGSHPLYGPESAYNVTTTFKSNVNLGTQGPTGVA